MSGRGEISPRPLIFSVKCRHAKACPTRGPFPNRRSRVFSSLTRDITGTVATMAHAFVLRIGYPWLEPSERLANVLAFTKKAGFDRVMLFNCRGHAEPAHYDREEILRRAPVIAEAARAFRGAGIAVDINNLATI